MLVVMPTKAVSVTKKTFIESMKKASPKTKRGPPATISAVSRAEARKVPALAMMLRLGAQARSPASASSEAAGEGDGEDQDEQVEHHFSFSFSRWRMSRLSNWSRIWKKNTPRMMTPISTSRAMPSSTTIGMP
jgi:hypothetical protein